MNGWMDEWMDGWREGWKDKWTNYLKRICLPCRRPWFNSWIGKIHWKRDRRPTPVFLGFTGVSAGKESACNAGDLGLIPGFGRSPGGGHGNDSSILTWRIPMNREAWATVHGVKKSQHNWAINNSTDVSNYHYNPNKELFQHLSNFPLATWPSPNTTKPLQPLICSISVISSFWGGYISGIL